MKFVFDKKLCCMVIEKIPSPVCPYCGREKHKMPCLPKKCKSSAI